MSGNRPIILVTNDDGISSKGIRSIVEVAMNYGEVLVVAPDKPQSGMGHAITMNHPLRLNPSDLFSSIDAYSCSGTPVDCVKLGIYEILKRKPDLVLSGINHGENTSTNVLYSGTMSAAVEGAMEGVPSVGFSLCDFDANADFEATKEIAHRVIKKVLENQFPKNICLNVNVPKGNIESIKGIKVCRQAHAFWEDRFDKRLDQFGNPYYWLTGEFQNMERSNGTDLHAIHDGYATVVPTQFDMTAHETIDELRNWNI